MKTSKAVEIAQKAIGLIDMFCAGSGGKIRPKDLLPREGQHSVHLELKEFAQSVVLHEHERQWGSTPYLKRDVAKTIPLFQSVDVHATPMDGLDGYGSWLYRVHAGKYAAVHDESLLTACNSNTAEVLVRLYLHELGHFVLHREVLFKDPNTCRRADKALPQMEDEAWFFAYIVLGLARGDLAAVMSTVADTTWQRWP